MIHFSRSRTLGTTTASEIGPDASSLADFFNYFSGFLWGLFGENNFNAVCFGMIYTYCATSNCYQVLYKTSRKKVAILVLINRLKVLNPTTTSIRLETKILATQMKLRNFEPIGYFGQNVQTKPIKSNTLFPIIGLILYSLTLLVYRDNYLKRR